MDIEKEMSNRVLTTGYSRLDVTASMNLGKRSEAAQKASKNRARRKIILTNGEHHEVWGSLVELCKVKGFSYNYLKRLKYPFEYRGIKFIRVPFRSSNGC